MRKLTIFFNEPAKKEPYGGATHFVNNFAKYLQEKKHKIIFNLKKNIDLIIIVSNSTYLYKEKTKSVLKYKKKYQKVKIIHRINNCDKRKNTDKVDKLIFNSNKISDKTIFVSNWLANYFIDKGFNKEYLVIYNGCNTDYFYPKKEKAELGDKINLVTHHWSNHWLKGFDIYNKIDTLLEERDDLSFTYIGNYNTKFKPKNIKLLKPLYGLDLGNELRKADIYITASRWEPGGNHYIEGASCGLPVLYHKDGGGTNELCKNFGLEYYNIRSLLDCTNEIKKSYHKFREKIPCEFLSSKRCCEEYYKLIQNMFN